MDSDQTSTDIGIDIPSPPELIEQLRKPGVDINSMGKLISVDAALGENILDTINAPCFNLVRQIQSIDEAVRFLGQDRILRFATIRALQTACTQQEGRFVNDIWASSRRVAVVCVLVARELKLSSAETAYELGLFHNAGMALMAQTYPDYKRIIRAAYKHPSGAISAFETHHLKTSHAAISAELAQKWYMDSHLVEVIREHHSSQWIIQQFEQDSGKDMLDLLALLKLSEKLAMLPSYIASIPTNYEWDLIEAKVMNYLDLNEMTLERLRRTVQEDLKKEDLN